MAMQCGLKEKVNEISNYMLALSLIRILDDGIGNSEIEPRVFCEPEEQTDSKS